MSRRFGIRFEQPVSDLSPAAVLAEYRTAPGLYLHLPFCQTICPFCPYNKVRYEAELAADYLDDLEREASMYLATQAASFLSLYVGGGTPTLCLDGLERLLSRLPITGERAIEVLPKHLTRAMATRLGALGFTYVSLGVQSFSPRVLRRLGRPGTVRASRAAIETALGAFECVDVDLIFDTAYDDQQTLLDDLDRCFEYRVHQVSTYPLMRFGYTPFGKGDHHRDREHALLRTATELARSHGYERRSVWTFNRLGAPTYTSITRPYYLGLGAGAASFAGAVFLVNHFGLDQYRRAIGESRLPVARMARLPGAAAAVYRSFWQAYTGTVPTGGRDPLLDHPVSVLLRDLSVALGWSRRAGEAVTLTESGYDRYHDLERWVTYSLIEPLWAELMTEHDPPRPTGSGSDGGTQ
ncbi:MAG: radical SAM protein [Micromonosporaceae bacterium]|nr:radical SAM protein [Micromonosporaceae bacterium]